MVSRKRDGTGSTHMHLKPPVRIANELVARREYFAMQAKCRRMGGRHGGSSIVRMTGPP